MFQENVSFNFFNRYIISVCFVKKMCCYKEFVCQINLPSDKNLNIVDTDVLQLCICHIVCVFVYSLAFKNMAYVNFWKLFMSELSTFLVESHSKGFPKW